MNDLRTAPAADHQTRMPPEARADRALSAFAREFGALTALRMESCIQSSQTNTAKKTGQRQKTLP